MSFSLVNKDDKSYLFVGGKTKYLAKMNQKELETLHENGDPRVQQDAEKSEPAKKTESAKPALPEAAK
jgi:hypothetical protein